MKFYLLFVMLFVTCFFSTPVHSGNFRRWTDTKGKRSIAKFAGFDDKTQTATLKKKNGSTIKIKLNQLSNADKKYVKHHVDSFKIIGYFPHYRIETPDKTIAKVTDLIYFSIEPKSNGELNLKDMPDKNIKKLKTLKNKYGFRLHLCVGGWGKSGNFPAVTSTAKKRAVFIKNLKVFCKKNQFNGVDYDWEFPRGAQQVKNYTALIAETSKAFKKEKLTVSAAIGSHDILSNEAYKTLDQIHLMAYDNGARHSTFQCAEKYTKRFLDKGLDPKKIILGVPFYGRAVNNRNKAISYSEVVAYWKPTPEVDEWLGWYFNGKNTISKKTSYALEKKLGGVMIWEIGQDSADDKTSLLTAINETLYKTKNMDQSPESNK